MIRIGLAPQCLRDWVTDIGRLRFCGDDQLPDLGCVGLSPFIQSPPVHHHGAVEAARHPAPRWQIEQLSEPTVVIGLRCILTSMHVAGGQHRQCEDRQRRRSFGSVTGEPAQEVIVQTPGEDPIPGFRADVRTAKVTELSSAVLDAQRRAEAVGNVIVDKQPEPATDVPPIEEVLFEHLLPFAVAEPVGHPHLPLLSGGCNHMSELRHVPGSRGRTL
jgi:hypothetical protein